MQAQLMAVVSVGDGSSVVTERVFENRFMHVPELQRMGADIALAGRSAHVTGVPKLMGAPVTPSILIGLETRLRRVSTVVYSYHS